MNKFTFGFEIKFAFARLFCISLFIIITHSTLYNLIQVGTKQSTKCMLCAYQTVGNDLETIALDFVERTRYKARTSYVSLLTRTR